MAQQMFNKIIGKKDKGLQIFNIPDKKYCHDIKKLNKIQKKDLLDEIEQMQKYISVICHKLEDGKRQYEKCLDKLQQITQKCNVLNSKMAMINNQHQQLQVKFSNLQNSLQIMTRQKQVMFKTQVQFIQSKQLSKQKISDLAAVLKVYRTQVILVQKIALQNKQLKAKYAQLQANLQSINQKMGESKEKGNEDPESQIKNGVKSRQQTQGDDDKKNKEYQLTIETKQHMISLLNKNKLTIETKQQMISLLNKNKLTIETKQHMISLLNKKINQQNQRFVQLQQKLNELKHQIQVKTAQIKQKEQDINRFQNQTHQYKRKINQLKIYQQQLFLTQKKFQQQIKTKNIQIQKYNQQNQQIKSLLKLIQQQKRILIGDQTQKIIHSQTNSRQFQLNMQLERTKLQHQIQAKDRQIQNLKSKINENQVYRNIMQRNLSQQKQKQKQYILIEQNLLEQIKKNLQLIKKLQDLQQNYEIKYRKLQFNANQQRIKADGLKRSLTNLQIKQQQNRKQLDQMYEKRVVQDNKFAKIQAKLKNYKQIINYLQKQKIQMQTTFQNQIRNIEEFVLHQNQQQQQNHIKFNSQTSQRHIIQKDQAIIAKLNSRIVDLQQQINFLRDENKNLASKNEELQQSTIQLQKNFKAINARRQQMMKQFNKMGSIDYNVINNTNIINKTKVEQKNNLYQNRAYKVAQKALRGFQILSKILHTLYKEFMTIHLIDIQRKQIKDIEGHINLLVKKCQDMKDIFQGYLQ